MGGSIGLTRAIITLMGLVGRKAELPGPDVCVIPLGVGYFSAAAAIASDLCSFGISVDPLYVDAKPKKLFELANRIKSRYVAVVGEDEFRGRFFSIKNMSDCRQYAIDNAEFSDYMKGRRKGGRLKIEDIVERFWRPE